MSFELTFFNLGIDTLLRYLSKDFTNLGYHYNAENNEQIKIAQTYADDLLIFTESKENLNENVAALVTFMRFIKISFNTSKCKLIINNPKNEIITELTLPDEFGQEKVVKVCDVK
jgi:hypothetical protein